MLTQKNLLSLILILCAFPLVGDSSKATLQTPEKAGATYFSQSRELQQCERCGKALGLREYLKALNIADDKLKIEASKQILAIDKFIATQCTNSDQEVAHAVDFCEDQSLNTLIKYYSNLTSGAALHPPANASDSANAWLIASKKLKAQRTSTTAQ